MQDTKLPVVQKNLTTELSTYKQELIEWAEGKKKYSPFSRSENIAEPIREYNRALSDLINHIKGEK